MGKQVTVLVGFTDVVLPAVFTVTNSDGSTSQIIGTSQYSSGDVVTLTDAEYAGLPIATSRALGPPTTVADPYRPVTQNVLFWKPNTAYAARQQLISPNNDVVSAIANHTSGSSYDASLYIGSGTYVTQTQLTGLIGAAPSTLDTLNELATALGDDPNFATTMATALGNRLEFDAAQSLNGTQQAQAQANLGLVVDGF